MSDEEPHIYIPYEEADKEGIMRLTKEIIESLNKTTLSDVRKSLEKKPTGRKWRMPLAFFIMFMLAIGTVAAVTSWDSAQQITGQIQQPVVPHQPTFILNGVSTFNTNPVSEDFPSFFTIYTNGNAMAFVFEATGTIIFSNATTLPLSSSFQEFQITLVNNVGQNITQLDALTSSTYTMTLNAQGESFSIIVTYQLLPNLELGSSTATYTAWLLIGPG